MNDTKPDPTQHPVWSVYDELRTARLNVRCLQGELRKLKLFGRGSEIIIAVSTTSAVGSFWFLQNKSGALIWQTVGALAVLLSITRPILKFADQIQAAERLLVGYSTLEHDLNCICMEVKHRKIYDNALHKAFLEAMDRKAELVKNSIQGQVSDSRRRKCEEVVLKELPASGFYVPES